MTDIDTQDPDAILAQLRRQAETDKLRITLHGHQEMVEEDISLEEILEVLLDATFVENYAEHRRGPCCLVCKQTSHGRYVHVVCTTTLEHAIIITVYEPRAPKWVTPFQRGK